MRWVPAAPVVRPPPLIDFSKLPVHALRGLLNRCPSLWLDADSSGRLECREGFAMGRVCLAKGLPQVFSSGFAGLTVCCFALSPILKLDFYAVLPVSPLESSACNG